MTAKENIFAKLSKIDVKPYVEKKLGLSYLSWAKAWGLVKSVYPEASYKIREFEEYIPNQQGWVATGRKVDYRLTSAGCEVEVAVEIEGERFVSKLYVMDNRNRTVLKPDYSQINKTQQRCLVKALAYAGLGLNIYAGEDLPTEERQSSRSYNRSQSPKPVPQKQLDPEKVRQQAEEIKVEYQGLKIPLITLYEDAKKDGKGSDTSEALHSLSNGDAKIMQIVKELVKVGA